MQLNKLLEYISKVVQLIRNFLFTYLLKFDCIMVGGYKNFFDPR